MNNLSWMLYLADVVGGLGILTGVMAGLILVVSLIMLIIAVEDSHTNLLRWAGAGVLASLFFFFVCILTPSKETVYAIAASEMGEELLKTPTAAKATRALDNWLDKQIAEQIKEPTP